MSDIFISYAREDRDTAERFAIALKGQGFSVWWDRVIPAGRVFEEVIEEAIGSSNCVVVLWSNHSIKSNWVKTEAGEGVKRNILIPIRIDKVELPFSFRRYNTADMVKWDGKTSSYLFEKLLEDINRLVKPSVNINENQTIIEPPNNKIYYSILVALILLVIIVIAQLLEPEEFETSLNDINKGDSLNAKNSEPKATIDKQLEETKPTQKNLETQADKVILAHENIQDIKKESTIQNGWIYLGKFPNDVWGYKQIDIPTYEIPVKGKSYTLLVNVNVKRNAPEFSFGGYKHGKILGKLPAGQQVEIIKTERVQFNNMWAEIKSK